MINRYRVALLVPFISFIFMMSSTATQAVPAESRAESLEFPTQTIANFNGEGLINNLGGESGTWEKFPDDMGQSIAVSIDNKVRHGNNGSSLKLEYDVNSADDAANGFWTQLRDLNASLYDHFEFWVKGDEDKGYTTIFKIEFKKIKTDRDGRDETIKASYVVKGVTGRWQKISIPLNVMNGISDWRELKEFVISFEKRRVDKAEGVLYFDDFAFTKTWQPGPSITDVVPHKKKKTDVENNREKFARFLIARLYGFPREVFVKRSFPKDDREFLLAVAKDTWKYFDKIVDKEHDLPLDNIQFNEK
ncbi:MAG: hypothetical protein KJ994_04350, partial [Candidatus Omnitrophica bacterium]|nr:hypothetical protein [Candidatus Omnitrophota bacterium]